MSMVKRCQEILETGDIDSKYDAASFLIRTKVDFSDLKGSQKNEAYANLVHEFCFRYNLKPKKLGKIIGTSE